MSEILRTPKNLILPDINIEDPEIKRILEEYNKIFFELITALYSDISRLHQRIYDLENP